MFITGGGLITDWIFICSLNKGHMTNVDGVHVHSVYTAQINALYCTVRLEGVDDETMMNQTVSHSVIDDTDTISTGMK